MVKGFCDNFGQKCKQWHVTGYSDVDTNSAGQYFRGAKYNSSPNITRTGQDHEQLLG